jgi:hypothetical protein
MSANILTPKVKFNIETEFTVGCWSELIVDEIQPQLQ